VNAPFQLKALFLAGCGMLLLGSSHAGAAEGSDGITAVASKTSSDYKRARLPDGSFQPEYYAFGSGGNWGGELKDLTIDNLSFLNVAHVIAVPLAEHKYLPAKDPNKTGLLIMVYWGTTAVPMKADTDPLYINYTQSISEYNMLVAEARDSPAANTILAEADDVLSSGLRQLAVANHQRDLINFKNASMLGYDADGLIGTDYGRYIKHTALGGTYNDEVGEIEDNRYFVVLMAYDFQLLWKQKKHKLLWETRFSIREKDHQFDRDLPAMAHYASQYFGQDSHGLVRKTIPLGHVEIGEVKSLGTVPEIQTAPAPAK
jgi:hypothetical protein